MAKAVALLSGGLDSSLAAKVMMEQGVEVVGLHLVSIFCEDVAAAHTTGNAAKAARALGIEMHLLSSSDQMLEIVRNPKHGFGKNLNPCVDCRISMLRRAVAFAREIGADFVVSGEVVGQRPMSQRLDAMKLIDKEAGVESLVVRPLCGKLLPATKAEKDGLIDREKLLNLRGRSRKPQMELARKFGLVEYPSPAGGCLLTEAHFARRMRDLLNHGEPDINDVGLLKSGRHFRLDEKTKAVIGKDDEDNKKIAALARKGDSIITTVDVPGPTTLVRGDATERNVDIAARLTARYSQGRAAESVTLAVSAFGEEKPAATLRVKPAALDEFREMLIE